MPHLYRVLKCLMCRRMQIVPVTLEVTWKCKVCDCTQLLDKVYFKGRLGMCEFYLEYVVEKKTHTCEIVYDGENPSTSKGVIKKVLFKPVAGNQAKPEPMEIDQGKKNNDKENKRKNVEIEKIEGEDFLDYLQRKMKARCKQNENVDL